MVYNSIDDLLARARSGASPKRMAVVGAGEDHTIQAVISAKRDGFVVPVLVGEKAGICGVLSAAGEHPDDYEIVDTAEAQVAQTAVALVRNGEADFLMKGNLQTAVLLKAVLDKEIGLRDGNLLSHLLFMQIPATTSCWRSPTRPLISRPTWSKKSVFFKIVFEPWSG